jgi:predicted Zn-dependent peptidase
MAPIQRFTLGNGLAVVLVEEHQVPVVQFTVLLRSGIATEPAAKSGLATMVATMLTDGAGTRDALQLADAVDFLGADLSASAGFHSAVIQMYSPLARLDSALALLADVVIRPTFPAAELERRRKERLTGLLQWRDEPRAIATVLFNRTLYSADHPYGLPTSGTEATIRAMKVADLQEYHAQHYRPNNATVIVVGDVTVASVRPRLEAMFGGWAKGSPASRPLPDIKQVTARNVYLVDKPGAAQTEIRIGCVGVPRVTDDYYALVVMNTILGGSFSSRLNQNLREQHGYTYGAGSSFSFRALPGPFLAASAVQSAVTDKALTEFMKELNGILQPVPEAEVARARNYVALSYPDEFQTVRGIAGKLEEIVMYNLPDNTINEYVEKVLAVTGEDVHRVAKKYLDPGRMAVVLVGDRKVIGTGVEALKLGPIKNLTIDDVLGKAPQVAGD